VTPTTVPPPAPTLQFKDWFYVLLVILGSAVAVSWYGIRQAITRWGLRWALCGIIGGMVFYNYIALDLPGSQTLLKEAGTAGVILATLIGVLLGWIVGMIWRQIAGSTPRLTNERPSTGPKSQSG
jgi:predicted permease